MSYKVYFMLTDFNDMYQQGNNNYAQLIVISNHFICMPACCVQTNNLKVITTLISHEVCYPAIDISLAFPKL